MQLLSTVEDSFQIEGRGCVVALKPLQDIGRRVHRREPIRLVKPDGSTVDTLIGEIEIVSRRRLPTADDLVAFTLPEVASKSDVPNGTEVWLLND
jgi:hypothetical protein